MDDAITRVVERGLRGEVITDLVDGWSFRIDEVSSNMYKMEGQDEAGHHVMNFGADYESVVLKSIEQARNLAKGPMRAEPLRTRIRKWFRGK